MVPIIIFVMLACIILYALYMHLGPFAYNADSFADRLVNVVAALLSIGLPILLIIELLPAQISLFAAIMIVLGFTAALFVVEFIAVILVFVLFTWISIASWKPKEPQNEENKAE